MRVRRVHGSQTAAASLQGVPALLDICMRGREVMQGPRRLVSTVRLHRQEGQLSGQTCSNRDQVRGWNL